MFRTALAVSAICAVTRFLGIVNDHRVAGALTLMTLAGPIGTLLGTSIGGRRLAGGGTLAGLIGGGFAGVTAILSSNWSITSEYNLSVLGLVLAVLMYRTLKRDAPTGANETPVRNAARCSLLAIALMILLSILRQHSMHRLRYGGSDPAFAIDVMKAVLWGATVLPWIVLWRRRAQPAGKPNSRWDMASKVLLLAAAMLGPAVGLLVALLHFIPVSDGLPAGLGRLVLIALTWQVGLGVAGGCFVAGFAIQVWRDRWHLPLTIATVLWSVALWACVVAGMARL